MKADWRIDIEQVIKDDRHFRKEEISMRCIAFSLILGLLANTSLAETPQRDGFTLELGMGIGFTHMIPDTGESRSEVGLAPLSISLGGFLNNQMALMFRAAGTSYFKDNSAGKSSQIVLTFSGLSCQYWFSDQFFASAGLGLAIYDYNVLLKSDDDPDIREVGLGLSLRTGYSFANWENHSLRLSFELFPSLFGNGTIVAEAINFEWQWF